MTDKVSRFMQSQQEQAKANTPIIAANLANLYASDYADKHPTRAKISRDYCDRSTCVGCRYARITGCAKTAS